jgi:hypothetical protein
MSCKCHPGINPIQSTPDKPSKFLSHLMLNYPSISNEQYIEQPKSINDEQYNKPLFTFNTNTNNIEFNFNSVFSSPQFTNEPSKPMSFGNLEPSKPMLFGSNLTNTNRVEFNSLSSPKNNQQSTSDKPNKSHLMLNYPSISNEQYIEQPKSINDEQYNKPLFTFNTNTNNSVFSSPQFTNEPSKSMLFGSNLTNTNRAEFNSLSSPKNNQQSTECDDNEKVLFSWRSTKSTKSTKSTQIDPPTRNNYGPVRNNYSPINQMKSPNKAVNNSPTNEILHNKITSQNRTNNNSPTNETLHKKMKSSNRSVNNSPTNETTWRSTSPTMNNEQPVFSWRSNDK